jgi:hypothetical protein
VTKDRCAWLSSRCMYDVIFKNGGGSLDMG